MTKLEQREKHNNKNFEFGMSNELNLDKRAQYINTPHAIKRVVWCLWSIEQKSKSSYIEHGPHKFKEGTPQNM